MKASATARRVIVAKKREVTMATSNAFRKIMAGLEEMKADIEEGKFSGRKTVVSVSEVDVAKIRAKTGLSQDRFATVFGMSASTVRNWEQHRTVPEGPARVLLTLIDREPVAVARALRIGPHSAKKAKGSARAVG